MVSNIRSMMMKAQEQAAQEQAAQEAHEAVEIPLTKDRNYIFRLEYTGLLDSTEPNLQQELPELYNEILSLRAVTDYNKGLIQAALDGDPRRIEFFLIKGADVNTKSEVNAGKTALHLVMQKENTHEAVTILLSYGADMESKDVYGNNAIYCAAFFGRQDTVITLLIRGANFLSRSTGDGLTAVEIARKHNFIEIANLMTEEEVVRLRHEGLVAAIKAEDLDGLHSLLVHQTRLELRYSNQGTLGASDVGDHGATIIAQAISKGGLLLEEINFWDTGITDEGAINLFKVLHHLPVKRLCFSYNKISDLGVGTLIECFPPDLEHLDLGANLVTDIGVQQLAGAIKQHQHLKFIHLGCERVTAHSIPAFISALAENTSLVDLIGKDHFFTKDATLAVLLERNRTKKVTPEEFIQAAQKGIVSIIALGISGGLDINRTINRSGWSALHQAASCNQAELIRLLVTKWKADIEIQNLIQNHGWRPLHNAAWNGSKEAISILLELGADPQAKTIGPKKYANKTPAELAMSATRADTSAFIISEIKQIQAKQSDLSKKVELMQDEKSEEATLEAQLTHFRELGLIRAAREGNQAAIEYLLTLPMTDINAQDENGKTALMEAIIGKQTVVISLLLKQSGVMLNIESDDGDLALHYAVESGETTIVQMLVEAGCDLFAENGLGQTARMLAVENKNKSIAAYLKRAEREASKSMGLAPQTPNTPPQKISLLVATPVVQIKSEELTRNEELGQGGFGKVFKGTWNRELVAIKDMRATDELLETFQKEVEMLANLRNPRIVTLYGVALESNRCTLVMELMPQGSLRALLNQRGDDYQAFPWRIRYSIAMDVATGIEFLHTRDPQVLHRDIKSANVLLDEHYRAKLTDFGLTRFKEGSAADTRPRHQAVGTLAWMAPELLAEKPHTEKSDIYSLGILLWELTTHLMPYASTKSIDHIPVRVLQGKFDAIPMSTPTEFAAAIDQCRTLNPDERPNISTLLKNLEGLFSSKAVTADSFVSSDDKLPEMRGMSKKFS